MPVQASIHKACSTYNELAIKNPAKAGFLTN